ncbi:MAG TPA: hypothetical protein VGR55_09600 [Candidatus Acidoferrum sp.]|nr:hypothetical protein [Candidatus Acidoferrum sp.]
MARPLGSKHKNQAKKIRRVTLNDLAHFTIKSITPKANQSLDLTGVFTHLKGVRLSERLTGQSGFSTCLAKILYIF